MSQKPDAADWARYYRKTGHRPPRKALVRALDRFDRDARTGPLTAIDLGCGSGRDTIEILKRGWSVLAIDAEAAAIEGLRARPDLPANAALETRVGRFEEETWPPADLINAGFSLPLIPSEAFHATWARIGAALRSGGRFSGQLFGDRDGWVGNPALTFLSRSAVDALLAPFDVEWLEEEEEDSTTPRGTPKHWHLFHIVARKP